MSGEEASSSGAGSGSGRTAIPYDYNSTISKHERSANHNKPPMFNGDPKIFSNDTTHIQLARPTTDDDDC